MEPPVSVVSKPWICWFQLPAPNCERRVNRSDVTCSIYCGQISSGMCSGLKSLQTATSLKPWRPLFLAFFFYFFVLHTKNHATYFHSDKLDFKTNFFKKKIVLFSMLPSCHVIFPHSPHNIIMCAVPLEFVLCISDLFKIKIIIYLQLY
jgi:hypothetical protein